MLTFRLPRWAQRPNSTSKTLYKMSRPSNCLNCKPIWMPSLMIKSNKRSTQTLKGLSNKNSPRWIPKHWAHPKLLKRLVKLRLTRPLQKPTPPVVTQPKSKPRPSRMLRKTSTLRKRRPKQSVQNSPTRFTKKSVESKGSNVLKSKANSNLWVEILTVALWMLTRSRTSFGQMPKRKPRTSKRKPKQTIRGGVGLNKPKMSFLKRSKKLSTLCPTCIEKPKNKSIN